MDEVSTFKAEASFTIQAAASERSTGNLLLFLSGHNRRTEPFTKRTTAEQPVPSKIFQAVRYGLQFRHLQDREERQVVNCIRTILCVQLRQAKASNERYNFGHKRSYISCDPTNTFTIWQYSKVIL